MKMQTMLSKRRIGQYLRRWFGWAVVCCFVGHVNQPNAQQDVDAVCIECTKVVTETMEMQRDLAGGLLGLKRELSREEQKYQCERTESYLEHIEEFGFLRVCYQVCRVDVAEGYKQLRETKNRKCNE